MDRVSLDGEDGAAQCGQENEEPEDGQSEEIHGASVSAAKSADESHVAAGTRATVVSRRKIQKDNSQTSVDSEARRSSNHTETAKASKKMREKQVAPKMPVNVRANEQAVGNSSWSGALTAGRVIGYKELGHLLLQEEPDIERIGVDDSTDFVDGLCVFLNSGDAMNSKEFCLVCGSSSEREDILFCRDCGDCFHTSCFDPVLKIAEEKRSMWRCPACRICEICTGEDNWEQMLVCDECDRGFHTYCLKPPLKAVPEGGWRCSECVKCLSCGAKTPGPRAADQWRRDFRMCQGCWSLYAAGNYCPICVKVFKDSDDSIEMVQCDSCDKWVHILCGAMDNTTYNKLKSEDDFSWECPKCKGDVDVDSDDEIVEKFPLPKSKRMLENQIRLEEFCTIRLRTLVNEVRAMDTTISASTSCQVAPTQGARHDSDGQTGFRAASGGAPGGGGSSHQQESCQVIPSAAGMGPEEVAICDPGTDGRGAGTMHRESTEGRVQAGRSGLSEARDTGGAALLMCVETSRDAPSQATSGHHVVQIPYANSTTSVF